MNSDIPRISADYNKGGCNKKKIQLILNCISTISDLSFYQVKLKPGLQLILCDRDGDDIDMETLMTVDYSPNLEEWFTEGNVEDIKRVKSTRRFYKPFLCFDCRHDMDPFILEHGFNKKTRCPHCACNLSKAIEPPLELELNKQCLSILGALVFISISMYLVPLGLMTLLGQDFAEYIFGVITAMGLPILQTVAGYCVFWFSVACF